MPGIASRVREAVFDGHMLSSGPGGDALDFSSRRLIRISGHPSV